MKLQKIKSNRLYVLLVLIGLTYIFRNIYELINIKFWMHDSAFYFANYIGKLKEEGRWINYLLFNVIREINPIVSILIHMLCLGYFSYKISNNIVKDEKISFMFSLAVISIPNFYSQIVWPVTSLPAFLFLFFLPYLSSKLSKIQLFLISSIIFFGTFSNYYFLLPLIYLPEFYSKEFSKENLIKFLKEIILPWVICFLIGYISANIITYLITGQLITLASWRKATPINSISQLVKNFEKISNYFYRDLKQIIKSLGKINSILLLFFGFMTIQKNKIYYITSCILVILALYVTTLYHGIAIAERTSLVTWIGIAFLFLLNKIKFDKDGTVNIILCLIVTISFARSSYKNIYNHSFLTQIYEKELINGKLKLEPHKYNKVIILITNKEINRLTSLISQREGLKVFGGMEGLDETRRTIIPLLKSKGFSRFGWSPKTVIKIDNSSDIFIKSIDTESNLIISINEDFIK